jgi:hypothetical protein
MPWGKGKYDGACTAVRLATHARATLLIVIEGDRGTGFSLQTTDPHILGAVPNLLEETARQIRASLGMERDT